MRKNKRKKSILHLDGNNSFEVKNLQKYDSTAMGVETHRGASVLMGKRASKKIMEWFESLGP